MQELTRSAVTSSPGEVLPPRIHEILTARLRAPGIDLRVAQLAATLGAEFDEEPLRQLAGREVDAALFRLEDAALIERVAEVRLGRYRFRHGLMRDTAYETQVLPVRQKSHRSVAELLGATASTPGDLAVVAHHWDLAGDVAQSVPAYMVAAQAAQAAASHIEARQLLDRAQELTATLPEGDERDLTELMIRVQRTISSSSLYGYGYPDVFEDFTIAEEICRRLSDRPEIMPVQVGIWSYLLVRGSVDAASVVLEPLTGVLDDPGAAWFASEIKTCMGYSAFYQGRLAEAHRWLVEAWEGYGARSADAASSPFWPLPHDAVPVTAVALACVAALQGATEESALWERRALATAEELEFPAGPFSAAFVSVYLAWIRMITGNREEAREFGRRTMEIAERCRFDYFQLLGTQYVLMPEPGRPVAVADLEQYALGMDLVGHGAFRPTHLGIVAQNHHYLGDADPALKSAGRGAGAVGVLGGARAPTRPAPPPGRDHLRGVIPSGWTRRPPIWKPPSTSAWPRARSCWRCGPPTTWPACPTTARRTGPTGSAPCSSGSHTTPRAPNSPRPSTSWRPDVAGSRGAVAILGGGMGALTTAFELSEGDWTDRFERITVYQRGWRLGGKGASSRGAHGRIEEHGLHVLLGYYDQTFDVMRRCYEELDRATVRSVVSHPDMGRRGGAVEPGRRGGRARRRLGALGGVVQRRSPVAPELARRSPRGPRPSPWPSWSSARCASSSTSSPRSPFRTRVRAAPSRSARRPCRPPPAPRTRRHRWPPPCRAPHCSG